MPTELYDVTGYTNAHPRPLSGALNWTIDASLLTNFRRELWLEYALRAEDCSSLAGADHLGQWAQLLELLDHFSAAPLETVRLDVSIDSPPDIAIRTLEQMSWSTVNDILQRYERLSHARIVLMYPASEGVHSLERDNAVRYLRCIARGIPSLKAHGKVRLEWI